MSITFQGKKRWFIILILLVLAFVSFQTANAQSSRLASLSGKVIDTQGLPVGDAEIVLYINDAQDSDFHTETNHNGVFLLDFHVDEIAALELEITHPHF